MEPGRGSINNRTFLKPGWYGGKASVKPGEKSNYENALGPEGFPSAQETLYNGAKAKDRTQGRRLRDDSGHDPNDGSPDTGDAGDPGHGNSNGNGHAVVPLTPEKIDLLKQTPRTRAPDERRRLDINDLAQEGAWIHQKVSQAALEIHLVGNDKQKMIDWLNGKGFRFETTSQYPEEISRQMIHYWHLLPAIDQQQIALAKPVFFIRADDEAGTFGHIKGAANMGMTTDQEIVNTVFLKTMKELTQEELKEENVDKLLTENKYDIGAAAIKQRWYKSGYALKNVFEINEERNTWHVGASVANGDVTIRASDIYNTATMAHEMTHMRQDLTNGMYAMMKKATDARVRFGFYHPNENDNFTRVYRTGPQDLGDVPSHKRKLGSLARREERLAFTSRPKDAADPTSDRITRNIGSHDAETPDRQPLVKACFEALKINLDIKKVTDQLDPKEILAKMHDRIREVNAPFTELSEHYKPKHYDATWLANLRSLVDFIPRDCATSFAATRSITGIAKTGFSPSVDLTSRSNPYKSIIDTFEVVVDAQGSGNDYSADERALLKQEARNLVKWGLKTIDMALQSFKMRTHFAVEMQKAHSALFPELVGKFTDYSNKFFTNAVANTKAQLKEAVMNPKNTNNSVLRQAPAEVLQTLTNLRARWSRNKPLAIEYTTAAGFDKIPDRDWYEIGAKMGFFNMYAREYDAEANGLAMMAPEEFWDMYARWEPVDKMTAEKKEQIYNQATFIFSRGIYEDGRLPKYKTS